MKTLQVIALLLALCSTSHAQSQTDCQAWKEYAGKQPSNVLLDFSYAGYKMGEQTPPDVSTLNYTVYNVCDYGAVPNDNLSDRAALETIINKIGKNKPEAKVVIYFPEGDFILHTKDDDVNGKSYSIDLLMGHVVLKGAGRDRTRLIMADPNLPTDPTKLYSSPVMISIRNNGEKPPVLARVTGSAEKGEFSLKVDNTDALAVGSWVILQLTNPAPALIRKELGRAPAPTMTNLINTGVQVIEYHCIKAKTADSITFCEPMMHEVDPQWGWEIANYKHFENVGVEDLTFVGNAKDHFVHHGSWQDDGAYKPLNMIRLVNSWVRRVGFQSVSEALTIDRSANCSVLDVTITGRRGHSAVRAQGSTRIFIGKVLDASSGYLSEEKSRYADNAGQYHACGVSKQSIGCVIWNCEWGVDGCFEAHATQPRATLFDICKGGFMQYRMGGDKSQLPNHLDDLIIWNFNATATSKKTSVPFLWWDNRNLWLKAMPPTIIGFHGNIDIQFPATQVKRDDNHGQAVSPYSLYARQLSERLGGQLPQWLEELSSGNIPSAVHRPEVASTDADESKIYSLEGCYLGNSLNVLPAGIYIINGRKVVR